MLHNSLAVWDKVISENLEGKRVRGWLENKVNVFDFMQHFCGQFKGQAYDSDMPLPRHFPNAPICRDFHDFLKQEIIDRVRSGALRVIGREGQVEPPVVVLPITVEPSKPRKVIDCRYLNLWMKDTPFSLETLVDVARLVEKDDLVFSTDEKSGYDHVGITLESQSLFGIKYGGWYFVCTTLPFGWKNSAFIYQSIGLQVTSYLRKHGYKTVQYIDDRFFSFCPEDYELNAPMIPALTLMSLLGYTFSVHKLGLEPVTARVFLGLVVDSKKMGFAIPDKKRVSFMELQSTLLKAKEVDLRTLQRWTGKCISLMLVVPGAKLFIKQANHAISRAIKNSKQIKMSEDLCNEIQSWGFVANLSVEDVTPWRKEYHNQIRVATDASGYRFGAVVLSEDNIIKEALGDYWEASDSRPIHLKEAEAVLRLLQAKGPCFQHSRVDVLVDNQAVVKSWKGQGARDLPLNAILQDIFHVTVKFNIQLSMIYVSTDCNPSDKESRVLDMKDSMLSSHVWGKVDGLFGPHNVDLMALDSNAMKDREGNRLPHFTPVPLPGALGVNVFAQDIASIENPYVFPPFALIAPVIALLKEQQVRKCTVVVPAQDPIPVWWPTLQAHAVDKVCIARQGETGVLCVPSKKGFVKQVTPLDSDLWVFRLSFS